MIERDDDSGDYDQLFDVQNRLIEVIDNVTNDTTTFTHDASGYRVKTEKPDGTLIYTPYPGYEKEIVPSGGGQGPQQLIWRTTYTFNGQPIATRVMDNVTPANSGLYFLHNDHLGSASVMSSSAGASVWGTTARYLPFGNWRTEPAANLTDRGYTSHKHNNMGSDDIGLIYMNARYYVPGIARFASADTIVPNPANPQSYNRYSYVRNNPLNLVDPTGHVECDLVTEACTAPAKSSKTPTPPPPLVDFDGAPGETWTEEEMAAVEAGAEAVARALATAINEQRYKDAMRASQLGQPFEYTPVSPQEAYMLVYGTTVTFYKTGTACSSGCWGEHQGPVAGIGERVIYVFTQADDNVGDKISTVRDGINIGELWAVHELGHAFNGARINISGGEINPYTDLTPALASGELAVFEARSGMDDYPWQMNFGDGAYSTNEIFADYFLNWTYSSFLTNNAGKAQYRWMRTQMTFWLP